MFCWLPVVSEGSWKQPGWVSALQSNHTRACLCLGHCVFVWPARKMRCGTVLANERTWLIQSQQLVQGMLGNWQPDRANNYGSKVRKAASPSHRGPREKECTSRAVINMQNTVYCGHSVKAWTQWLLMRSRKRKNIKGFPDVKRPLKQARCLLFQWQVLTWTLTGFSKIFFMIIYF